MTLFGCENRRDCTGFAIVLSIIIGIIAAFLQITVVITVPPIFLGIAFAIAIAYLAVTLIATALVQKPISYGNACSTLSVLLISILGTIFSSIILLAIGFAATSIIGAIIVGVFLFFFSLMLTSTACFARRLINCNN